ncbi:MAG: hypothetical protein WC234_05560 [Endomicrobiaceae bacterium]
MRKNTDDNIIKLEVIKSIWLEDDTAVIIFVNIKKPFSICISGKDFVKLIKLKVFT